MKAFTDRQVISKTSVMHLLTASFLLSILDNYAKRGKHLQFKYRRLIGQYLHPQYVREDNIYCLNTYVRENNTYCQDK